MSAAREPPSSFKEQAQGGRAGPSWGGPHGSDTHPVYDVSRQHNGKHQHQKNSHGGGGGSGRRKQYRKLWEHVKTVHAGDGGNYM